MVQIGDVIQIRDCQTLLNKELCNIFYYLVAAWTGNATPEDILTVFESSIVPAMADVQGVELVHTDLRMDNISNGLDFADLAINVPGTRVGAPVLPTYVAASFRLNRGSKITRPGFKRIGGIQEDQVSNNNFANVDPAAVAFAAILSVDVVINIPNPASGTLRPVIVGRNVDGTFDLQRLNVVTSASALLNISTQVSRKA